MSIKLDHLQKENKKLRKEILKLQMALQDINQDISISNSPINISIPTGNKEFRKQRVHDIEAKLEQGIYSPPKERVFRHSVIKPAKKSKTQKQPKPQRSEFQNEESETYPIKRLKKAINHELDEIEVTLDDLSRKEDLSASKKKYEIEAVRSSLDRINAAIEGSKRNDTDLSEDFTESYIPVKENLQPPKVQVRRQKSKRGRRALLSEIKKLKHENFLLKFNMLHPESTARSATPQRIRRKGNRSRSISAKRVSPMPTNRSNNDVSPRILKSRSCKICDLLLSKGYSTKYCIRHGIKR